MAGKMGGEENEEVGRGWGFDVVDTDVEERNDDDDDDGETFGGGINRSDSDCSPSLSRYSDDDDASRLGSFTASWPQSYRQSIDVLSTVNSPSLGFLSGTGITKLSYSSLKHSTTEATPPTFTDPFLSSTDGETVSPRYLPLSGSAPKPSSLIPNAPSWRSSFRELPPNRRSSSGQALLNGVNVLCGVGLLSVPYAVKNGGWFSLVVLFVLGCISCYTGILLQRCLDSSPGLQTYPDIGQAAFGTIGRLGISIILYLELYACCVEFIILMSDNLSSLYPYAKISLMGINLSTHQLFVVTTATVILPTVWLKDFSLLSYLSAGGVISSIVVTICLFWVGVIDGVGFHSGGAALDFTNLPVAVGLYGFCYAGHSVFPNIYSSMRNRAQFPMVLIGSFIICTLLYAGVAVAGFLMFGESIASQFTLNMPHQFLASKFAVWTTVLSPLSKYALTMTPVALSIEELLPSSHSQSHFTAVLIRTVLVLSTLLIALVVPFFGFVSAFIGSFCAMFVALILPCTCYLVIRKSVSLLEAIICMLIVLLGGVCCCVGTYTTIEKIAASLG